MTVSTVITEPSEEEVSTQQRVPFKYDLRLEIGGKKDGETIQVVDIFLELARRLKSAADKDAPVVIMTATDKLFHEQKEMTSDEFQQAFKVDNTDGQTSKVLLGFKIHSLTPLSELKKRLMHTFLIPNNLFLRQHAGGFANGVKTYSFGFLKDDHPDHPDTHALTKRFSRICSEAWKKLDKEDRAKWRKELPNDYFKDTGIQLPITFTKDRVAAQHEGKEKIITHALLVAITSKYGKLMKTLLDVAITGKKLNNLIPFALGRDNPEGYYYMVAAQARFIENHRNIPVLNVPADANSKPGSNGKTLLDMLNAHAAVQRVSVDTDQRKYHVSTIATKYKELHQWIQQTLEENRFPFGPHVRPMRYGNAKSTTSGISYSDIFKDAISVASDKFTNATTKTNQTNPWKTRPPLAISYERNQTAFPPLSPTKPREMSTRSTTSETFDEDTIQSAISVAIKKLEEQHRRELTQLKMEMQANIDEVKAQMQTLGEHVAVQTYQALLQEESPLATKKDHAHLQQEISVISAQLTTIINIFQHGTGQQRHLPVPTDNTPSSPLRGRKRTEPSDTPEKMSVCRALYTEDNFISSATSDPDEGMEGCEE